MRTYAHDSGPELVDLGLGLVPSNKGPLHEAVKVAVRRRYKLGVVHHVAPLFGVLESAGRPGTADDEAAVGSVCLIVGGLGSVVLHHGLELAHRRARIADGDATTGATDWADDLAVLGQQATRVSIGCKHHLLCLDLASRGGHCPVAIGVGRLGNFGDGCVGLEVDALGDQIREQVQNELVRPRSCQLDTSLTSAHGISPECRSWKSGDGLCALDARHLLCVLGAVVLDQVGGRTSELLHVHQVLLGREGLLLVEIDIGRCDFLKITLDLLLAHQRGDGL